MAKLRVSDQLIIESIFGNEPIRIESIKRIDSFGFEFEIEGDNIPNCKKIMCTEHVEKRHFTFEEIE